MKIKKKINDYLKQIGYTEKEINAMDSSSVYLAQQIAIYAHRGQRRLNGIPYAVHPFNALHLYRNFVGIVENDPFCISVDLMNKNNIPFEGVQEVCLLHDVLEDTEVTIEEIEEVFAEFGLKTHFNLYIKKPLLLVTHEKSEGYHTYIAKLLDNPTASIVKFMDMVDNLNPLGLNELGAFELERMQKYAGYCKIINDKWHFLENIMQYKQEFAAV